ncbi:MAG: hypothetical protein LBH20_04090 [Treponema sp.]|jgi:hypothetical protein|nr:hypothetical protein [Treponema sp.]
MAARKVRILELARAGKWGLDGSEITRSDITELAETIAGKRPVVIGHDVTDRAPKFGDVLDCWPSTDGGALIGPVMFTEAGDRLYEDGAYNGWSVSMPRREADGKRVLHHLAILGAVPPKIPGLTELAQVAVNFGESATGDAGKDTFQFSGVIPEKEDNDLTEEEKKALAEKDAKIAELEAQNKALQEQAAKATAAAAGTETKPETAAPTAPDGIPADGTAGGADFADVHKQLGEIKAERRRERLESFARDAAGKLPAGVATKANALAAQVEAVGAFDFSDNGKTEKRDALWVLGDILRLWPQPVKTGASGNDYGDGTGGEKPVDWAAITKKM